MTDAWLLRAVFLFVLLGETQSFSSEHKVCLEEQVRHDLDPGQI